MSTCMFLLNDHSRGGEGIGLRPGDILPTVGHRFMIGAFNSNVKRIVKFSVTVELFRIYNLC